MADETIDRELLRTQRKIRKKEKKEARRLEKQQEKEKHVLQVEIKSAKISVISSKPDNHTMVVNDRNFPSLNVKGLGRNKHVKSNMPTNISLDSLIKDTKEKQTIETATSRGNTYIGNRLDSSQPVRYQGKHREQPQKKRLSKLKSEITQTEEQRKNTPGQQIMQYSDNIISDDLKEATKNFIKKIVDLQEKAFSKNAEKAKMKKRYVVGFHEIKKYLIVKKVQFLIIADDLKIFHYDEPLYKTIEELVELAKKTDIPYVYALKRAKIGNLTYKNRPVSCFAVLNKQSAEEELSAVLQNIERIPTENANKTQDEDYKGLLEALKD